MWITKFDLLVLDNLSGCESKIAILDVCNPAADLYLDQWMERETDKKWKINFVILKSMKKKWLTFKNFIIIDWVITQPLIISIAFWSDANICHCVILQKKLWKSKLVISFTGSNIFPIILNSNFLLILLEKFFNSDNFCSTKHKFCSFFLPSDAKALC